MGDATREALFISHANPEDNAFTLWLGAKLTGSATRCSPTYCASVAAMTGSAYSKTLFA